MPCTAACRYLTLGVCRPPAPSAGPGNSHLRRKPKALLASVRVSPPCRQAGSRRLGRSIGPQNRVDVHHLQSMQLVCSAAEPLARAGFLPETAERGPCQKSFTEPGFFEAGGRISFEHPFSSINQSITVRFSKGVCINKKLLSVVSQPQVDKSSLFVHSKICNRIIQCNSQIR